MYDRAYFETNMPGSERSAEVMVPLLLGQVDACSAVDVGCGTGTWLAVLKRHGVGHVLGIDGDYVDRAALQIPTANFIAADLTRRLPDVGTFDLAISLEVAEHLPPARAGSFVADLVALAPAVAFSAAIPAQGGDGHVNEQWPDYWQALFTEHGYGAIDVLRKPVWDLPDVEPWYAQNTFLYVKDAEPQMDLPVRVVHPRVLELSRFLLRRDLAKVPLRARIRRALR
jgi:SAM-dependent methyltransferase